VFFSKAAGAGRCEGKEVFHGTAMLLFLFHCVNIMSLIHLLQLV